MNIESSINRIMDELDSIERRREAILKGIRDILMYCRKAIVAIHSRDLPKAMDYISISEKKAEKKHEELKEYADDDLSHYLVTAESEMLEAKVLYAIANNDDLPAYDGKVMVTSYILGLLDCIGEMKRMVLDHLRNDEYDKAVNLFKMMEGIYSLLIPSAAYDNILQGIRRKLDLNRILIESVREVITEESRRKAFLKELKNEL